MMRVEHSDAVVWGRVFEQLTAARRQLERFADLPVTDPRRVAAEMQMLDAEAAFYRLQPEFTVDDDA